MFKFKMESWNHGIMESASHFKTRFTLPVGDYWTGAPRGKGGQSDPAAPVGDCGAVSALAYMIIE
jgi:hypothetical protein